MHAPTKIAEAAPRNVSLLLIMELLFNDETYVLLADLVVRSVALLRRSAADTAERLRDSANCFGTRDGAIIVEFYSDLVSLNFSIT